jgi:hypothetical protein
LRAHIAAIWLSAKRIPRLGGMRRAYDSVNGTFAPD